jgi:penicillin-binding protein 2
MAELKNVERELLRFRRRLLIAMLVVVLSFVLLIARWLWLQVIRHRQYSLQARDNRIAIVPQVPSRGLILDRNGIVLANNYAAYTLEVTPSKTVGLEPTLAALRAILPIPPGAERRFRNLLAQRRSFEATPLRDRLSDAEVARFVAQRFRFPGVEVRARLYRNYPLGTLGCHAIGFIGRIGPDEQDRIDDGDQADNYQGTDHIGKTGVELSYERQLHGDTGFDEVEVNSSGKPVRKLRSFPAVPGSSLVLSIDIRMQKLAEDLFGARTGACIAIDPRNGELLTLASLPTSDPNLFVDGIDPDNWNALNTDPQRPLLNRALRGAYPPGSTYKPYLGLGALSLGLRSASYTLNDPGYFMLGSHKFRDDVPGGHGRVDMHRALAVSCDTYFYMLANDWDVDAMHDYTARFGFGQPTGVDLPDEARGILPSRAWKRAAYRQPAQQRWYPGETISLGIGQGYNSFTPMQIANALATLANGGTRWKPRIVKMVENMQTRRFEPTAPQLLARLGLPQQAWQTIHDAMVGVNSEDGGTGSSVFRDAPYSSAGKTGTAQVFTIAQNQKYRSSALAKDLQDHALYVVYAPAEAPRICVALIVEHGGFGAQAAAPIARRLIDYHLLGKYPSDAEIAQISGVAPQPVQFQYAGERNGVPAVPGTPGPPASHPGPASAPRAASAPAAPASAASAPAPTHLTPWPAASAAPPAAMLRPRCDGAPLFTQFAARHDNPRDDEGIRL